MKAIIEYTPVFETIEEQFFFIILLETITRSYDEESLRENINALFKRIRNSRSYVFGYGSHHLWVKKSGDSKRSIIVEF
ncbi:MAG: hypothetical protein ACLUVC_14115 [Longibaculum sp.]|jgi:hypothetical protein